MIVQIAFLIAIPTAMIIIIGLIVTSNLNGVRAKGGENPLIEVIKKDTVNVCPNCKNYRTWDYSKGRFLTECVCCGDSCPF